MDQVTSTMRIVSAIALLILLVGCQRSSAPQPRPASDVPATAAATALPMPPTITAPKAAKKPGKKAATGVLATVAAKTRRQTEERPDSFDNNDPCAGLEDAALDDCLARGDAAPANNPEDRNDPSPDRPELTPHDRELMEADEDAARDREGVDRQDSDPEYDSSQDAESDYDRSQDPSSDDYPPDENSDEPLPDEPSPDEPYHY
jgi:hypothetical protein